MTPPPARGDRQHDDPPSPYHDSPEQTPLSSQETVDGDQDALSFLRIDGEDYEGVDEYFSPPWHLKQSWLARNLPARLTRAWRATVRWTKGPQPPRPWKITPFFEDVQTYPIWIRDQFLPKKIHKIAALAFLYFCWLLTFTLVLKKSAFAADIEGYGSPNTISCYGKFWYVGEYSSPFSSTHGTVGAEAILAAWMEVNAGDSTNLTTLFVALLVAPKQSY